MNKSPEFETRIKYNSEEKQRVADLLDGQISLYAGSVFLTALDIYSQFELLQSTRIILLNDFDRFVGGVNKDGQPVIVLANNHEIVTPGLKSRILKRFVLPSNLKNAPTGFFKLFIFAHELGHVVQADPQFQSVFGEIDNNVYSPEEDYVRYVESDHEVNANYIAATIIAESVVGKTARYNRPDKPPMQWKDWANEHRVVG